MVVNIKEFLDNVEGLGKKADEIRKTARLVGNTKEILSLIVESYVEAHAIKGDHQSELDFRNRAVEAIVEGLNNLQSDYVFELPYKVNYKALSVEELDGE